MIVGIENSAVAEDRFLRASAKIMAFAEDMDLPLRFIFSEADLKAS